MSEFSKLVDSVIAEDLPVITKIVDEIVEDITDFGSPEKLIGKPYEEWTPQDLIILGQVYGPENESPLGRLIAKHKIAELRAGEKAQLEGV